MPETNTNRKPERDIQIYADWDLDGMTLELENMGERGQHPVRLEPICWWISRGEPQKRKFQLACRPRHFDPAEPETARKLEQLKQDTGWELVSSQGTLLAFANPDPDPPPLFPGLKARRDNLIRGTRPAAIGGTLLFLLLLALSAEGIHQVILDPVAVFADTARLYLAQLWPMLAIFVGGNLISRWVWCIRSAGEVRSGSWLPTWGHVHVLSYLLFLNMFIVPAVHLSSGGPLAIGAMVLLLLAVGILLVPLGALRGLRRRRGKTNGIFSALVLPLALATALCWGTQELVNTLHDRNWAQAEPPVEAWQLTGQSGRLYEYTAGTRKSMWARDSYYTSFVPDGLQKPGAPAMPELSCRVVDTGGPSFAHDFAYLTFRRQGREEGLTTRETDPAPWGAARAWQQFDGDRPVSRYLILLGDSRTAALTSSWDLTPDQMARAGRLLTPGD